MEGVDAPAKNYKPLFIAGGVCAFLIPLLYCVESLTFAGMPAGVREWLELFARNRITGYFYINSIDIFSIALTIPMFAAFQKMFASKSPSLAALGAPLGYAGAAAFIASRSDMTLASARLGQLYGAAQPGAEREALVSAARAIQAPSQATPLSTGFFLIGAAIMAFSLAMLGRGRFWRGAGIIGLLAGSLVGLANLSISIAPILSMPLMAACGVSLFCFWILAGLGLMKAGRAPIK
jgi:hypothetical protein